MQKYQVIERIGEGAYGIVLKCRCNDMQLTKRKLSGSVKHSDIVAMKKFKDSDDNQIVKRTTLREVKVLKMLSHPNVVQLKQAFRKKGFVYLIFQYVRNNLLEVLEKSPDGLDPNLIRIIVYQMIKGLAYMHSQNVIHRDIKPENLLVSEDFQLKICDFGFARVFKKKEELTDYVATRWYRAPELLVGARYGKQIDMWAVGCIMAQLIDGNPLFPGEDELDQIYLIKKCLGNLTTEHEDILARNPRFSGAKFQQILTLETIDKRYMNKSSQRGLNLLKGLLKMNPSERLTSAQALQHPYFEGIQHEQVSRKYLNLHLSKNDSTEQTYSPAATSSMNERKKNGSMPYHPVGFSEFQRQKTEHSHHYDNIFNVTKVQKLNIGKKKKQDNFMNSKGMSNYNSTNVSKSLGKNKVNSKMLQRDSGQRHISLQKSSKRQNVTKTQTGFYIQGGSIIPQRLDQDQESAHFLQPQQHHNRIYNIRSPKSRAHPRKQTNVNTEQIIEEQNQGIWQSTGQLPFLMASHKSHENKHNKNGHLAVTPNIVISNSTFNHRHH